MFNFVWAAVILGVSVVYVVPWISGVLKTVLPSTATPYLPSSTVPADLTAGLLNTAIYGGFILLVLMMLSRVGIKAEGRGVRV